MWGRWGYYWRIYVQIIKFNISLLLAYRLNAFLSSLHAFVYISGVYFSIQIAFTQTNSIGGYTKPEIIFMFLLMMSLWTFLETLFFESARRFVSDDVRNGSFDSTLLKPVIPQVYMLMSHPYVTAFLYGGVIWGIFFWYGLPIIMAAPFLNILGFISLFAISVGIYINTISSYASLAFFMTKSSQLLRTLQSTADYTFYPTTIYPQSLQYVFFTLIPTAFSAYVPSAFLFGKSSSQTVLWAVVWLFLSHLLNRLLWKKGLQNYTSASS